MRVLITGGAGFIGSHLAEFLQSRAEVRILDDLRTGHARNLEGIRAEWIRGSILDPETVARSVEGADYVFHLAALVSVPESVEKPHEAVALNVTGLLHVLEASAAAGVKKLCFASSAAVYGDDPAVPKVETMVPRPKSPYAVTKLDGEYYCGMFAESGRLATACLRFFNVFGPRQDPASAYAAAVPIFICRALAGQPLTIFGDGEQTRDFVYVKDIAAALWFAATTPGLSGVFNAGYGRSVKIADLARRIASELGGAGIVHAPPRAGDVRDSLADPGKLMAAGFRPVSDFESGLAETIRWYSEHRPAAT